MGFMFEPCGEALLSIWGARTKGFIFLLLLLGLHLFIAFRIKRTGDTKIWSILLWFLCACNFSMVVYTGVNLPLSALHYQDFQEDVWKAKGQKPIAMIRTICKDQRYLGITREELKLKLGEGIMEGSYSAGDYMLYYDTDNYTSFLGFTFRNNRVVEYTLV